MSNQVEVLSWWPYPNDGDIRFIVGVFTDPVKKELAKIFIQEQFADSGLDISENAFDEDIVLLNNVLPELSIPGVDEY